MGAFDYGCQAGLFSVKFGKRSLNQTLRYRRFVCSAEAIRFAVEELSPGMLLA